MCLPVPMPHVSACVCCLRHQLSASATDRVHQHSAEMARDGLRVIAIASGAEPGKLTLCGIVGLKDPLRDGVADAVHRIQDSGARVMMITGDSQETATSIARSAGIYDPHRCPPVPAPALDTPPRSTRPEFNNPARNQF